MKKAARCYPNCFFILWEHTGSNRGPSACKADALNQLSYAPYYLTTLSATRFVLGSANIGAQSITAKIF